MRRCLIVALIMFILLPSLCLASRGISLNIKKDDGGTEQIPLYKESHALLVGVSDYTNGWPDLESIPGEMDKLETVLKEQGFNVVKVLNPDSRELADSFEDFVDHYGYEEESRLLFFFSGHGYSRKDGKKGYIVPADAPVPTTDEKGFLRKAIGMRKILTWARQIESKHALFLFDSCFSGTVFKTRALPSAPPHISSIVAKPVRQFISAGSAGEEVPARSVFVPTFIKALRGEGDLDNDGYVTGTELGMFLHRKVMSYESGQTPQYGKIRDPDLDEGDFVLMANLSTLNEESKYLEEHFVPESKNEFNKKDGSLDPVYKYYDQSKYDMAILSAEDFMTKNPTHIRVPEALFIQAKSFVLFGDKETGKILLNKVINTHKDSVWAEKSNEMISNLN